MIFGGAGGRPREVVLYGSHGVTRTVLCSATFPQNAGALGMQQLGLGAGGTFGGFSG